MRFARTKHKDETRIKNDLFSLPSRPIPHPQFKYSVNDTVRPY